MPRALSEETKQQVINLWMNHNYSQQQVADYLCISYKTVNRIVNEYTADGAHEPPKGMPMPERAVPAMPIEQVTKPIVMTEEHTAAPPDVVRKAVLYRIADIDEECSAAEAKINALREKIRDLTKERGELEIWLEEVKRDDSTEN